MIQSWMSTALGYADCTLKRLMIMCDVVILSVSLEFEEIIMPTGDVEGVGRLHLEEAYDHV